MLIINLENFTKTRLLKSSQFLTIMLVLLIHISAYMQKHELIN